MKTFFKTSVLVLVLFAGQLGLMQAQDFLPAANDNYMGINQVTLQPAAIVDSRFKVDVNLFGYSSDIYNNMFRFEALGLMRPYEMINDGNWWDDNHSVAKPNGKDKSAFVNAAVLGPSFLLTLGPKHAIGFSSRVRAITNAEGVGEPLAYSIYDDFKDEQYWQTWYKDENIRAVQNIFADYGLSYATEVYNTGEHYIKTGMTVKLLQGMGGAHFEAEELYYYFQNDTTTEADFISWNSPYVDYGASDNWDWQDDDDGLSNSGFRYTYISSPSIGLDLGAVYEWRPDHEDYVYDMDGETGIARNDLNKYFIKVGISILDIGRLKYKKAYGSQDFTMAMTPDYLTRYQNGDNGLPPNTHWMDIEEVSFRFPPYVDLTDTINNRIAANAGMSSNSKNSNTFIISLPTSISLQADVNVVKGLYVNLTTFTALQTGYKKRGRSHYISSYSVTPRYEHKWFSVMLPMIYGGLQKFNMGIGIRAGFVYAGVNNLISGLVNDPYGTSFYFGVKVPIWHGKPPSDRDLDGVSDLKDRCLDDPGTWELLGCPDRDGDGIVDIDDLCPDIPGPKIYSGCPDTDEDGIPDHEDDCPNVPGDKLTKGCPDTDGDGVIDSRDECPDVQGPAELHGCPDRDGDGLVDYKDNCPDLAGPIEQGGCPYLDADKDGVKDSEDDCPEVAGPPENKGCPYSDSDGDGVIDKDDRCPLTPGDPTNFGCPIIEVAEAAVLKTAFENLEFETGKSIIRSSSFASLNELAALLVSKPTWNLKISGHTDNTGSDAINMKVSKSRSEAVAKYMKGKGVASDQLIIEWFGESKPVADNNTPEGRQINRRVEMVVEFD